MAGTWFNRTWEMLDQPSRSPDDDAALVHATHASVHHWSEAATIPYVARGEWLCAGVYWELAHAEPALWHARRCLTLVQAGGDGSADWDLAPAHEAVARAHSVAGELDSAVQQAGLARAALERVTDADDRVVVEADLDALALD